MEEFEEELTIQAKLSWVFIFRNGKTKIWAKIDEFELKKETFFYCNLWSIDSSLKKPYYVYDELLWLNATFGDKPVKDLASGLYKEEFHPKHSDDYYFM